MSQILNKVRDVDPNNSDAVKEVLLTFFQNLVKHTDVDSNRWLRTLENIINRFPKYCGTHRNSIETYLTNFLYCNNYYNVIEAAKCAHALQQVRPSQEKTATPKACWREHLTILCNAAHRLIGSMFANAVDMYKNSGNALKKQLQSSATSPLCLALDQITSVPKQQHTNKQALLTTRLRNVFAFIQAALVEIYPVAKPVQPQTVLEVIVRALSVSSAIKQDQDMTKVVSVKLQALRTMDALVACLGPNLIPFSALIFKFVLLTLKWSSENTNEESSQVRRGAYDTLRRWLHTLGTHRLADSSRGRWEDELAQHIVTDITPARHIVQLTMSNHSTKHLSKKAKRKLANSMLQESTIASHTPGEKNKIPLSEETNDELALSALECAETFLHVCGVFLKPTTHKLFQERVVRECYIIEAYSTSRALGLVRVLEALRKTTPCTVPPPTQYCLQLYSVLVNSRIDEISKFSSQALLDIRLHLHCSPPSLGFAIDAPVRKPDKPAKMSSRNRIALETLLGAEKVPPETTEDVISITIPDEPTKKKPRLDTDVEISDKISVSSDSASDVEISDDSDVQEVNADGEDEATADKSVEPESEYTADNNTADSATTDVSDKPAQTIQEESQETTTQGTSEPPRTDEESRDAAANASESTQPTEEPASQEGDTTDAPTRSIYSAHTQMPLNASTESSEEHHSPHSMEVAYDFPCTATDNVTILEKTDDDLPCTNDTDDIAITCGQVVRNSQEKEADNKENEEPKMNGDKSPEKSANILTDKAGNVTVEDMLADFVDEVNEEKAEA